MCIYCHIHQRAYLYYRYQKSEGFPATGHSFDNDVLVAPEDLEARLLHRGGMGKAHGRHVVEDPLR